VTLERDGVNGFSRLPADPAWYIETARGLGDFDGPETVGGGLRQRIAYDLRWQAANYVQAWRYPRFRTHRPYPIWAEYASWATRLAVLKHRQRTAEAVVADLLAARRPFHLFALQLDTDSQIRVHSPFARLPAAIEAVIKDFAAHAPAGHLLLIKNHPLDNGWIHYPRLVARLARRLGVADRVRFIDGGDLNALIDAAQGTVSVNSTVGMTALERGRPVICLGHAIYDVPGLTFDGPLAAFWHGAPPPDAALYDAFRRVVMHGCLVNGNFYTDQGVALAVEASVTRLEGERDLLAGAPPRG
jgi:capsular polysaccharide export protein